VRNKNNKECLPFGQKLSIGVGATANNLMQNSINNMANQVLNIFLGVNPVLVSVAIFIARIWDAFTDPVMGAVSDNTRTRFGRRRPYVLLGGILGAIVFNILWRFPTGMSEMGYFGWFLGWSLVFYTCYTIYIVPFDALSYEVTSDYNDRTRVMVFKSIFGGVSGITMAWIYKITQWDCFENTLDGMQAVAIWIGVILVAVTAVPAFRIPAHFRLFCLPSRTAGSGFRPREFVLPVSGFRVRIWTFPWWCFPQGRWWKM
jgi:GPH family glycoside/pentoside/hexuronide:cation symporter